MQRRLVIVVSARSAGRRGGGPSSRRRRAASGVATGRLARQFVGYWMGIDPLDGGDSRRGDHAATETRTFALIGRDTVFTLCDGTDRAIVTVDELTVRRLARW